MRPIFVVLFFFSLLPSTGWSAQGQGPRGMAENEMRVKGLWQKSQSHILRGEYDQALIVLDEIIAAVPRNAEAYYYRGLVRGRGDVAQKHQNRLPRSSFRIAIATAVPPTPN